MKYYLAAYDLAHRSSSGDYWVWKHPSLSPLVLSKAYDLVRERGLPERPNEWPPDYLRGGFGRLDEEWFLAHRYYNGGYDGHGRPQRWVLLCGFMRADELLRRDPIKLLTYGPFADWSRGPVALPLPAPSLLEGELAPDPAISVNAGLAKRLREAGKLEQLTLGDAVNLVTSSSMEFLTRMSITGSPQSAAAEVWSKQNRPPASKNILKIKEIPPYRIETSNLPLPQPGSAPPPVLRNTRKSLRNYLLVSVISFALGALAGYYIRIRPHFPSSFHHGTSTQPSTDLNFPSDPQPLSTQPPKNNDKKAKGPQ